MFRSGIRASTMTLAALILLHGVSGSWGVAARAVEPDTMQLTLRMSSEKIVVGEKSTVEVEVRNLTKMDKKVSDHVFMERKEIIPEGLRVEKDMEHRGKPVRGDELRVELRVRVPYPAGHRFLGKSGRIDVKILDVPAGGKATFKAVVPGDAFAAGECRIEGELTDGTDVLARSPPLKVKCLPRDEAPKAQETGPKPGPGT